MGMHDFGMELDAIKFLWMFAAGAKWQLEVEASTWKPLGRSTTWSPWLIQTFNRRDSWAKRVLWSLDLEAGQPELPFMGLFHLAARAKDIIWMP